MDYTCKAEEGEDKSGRVNLRRKEGLRIMLAMKCRK